MKKFMTIMLAAMMAATMLFGCGAQEEPAPAEPETKEEQSAEEEKPAEEKPEAAVEGFPIYYPSWMQEENGEALVLEQKPEKAVILSNSALQIAVRNDIKPIAITNPTASVTYPDWVGELPVIKTGMSELDIEGVIALEPDLVIMGSHLKEDYGKQLDDAGIPVYYTSEGPSITYSEVKEEAITLSRSFGGDAAAKEVEDEFAAVEKRAAEFKESHESKQTMILFGAPPSHQQTSKGYLGSILSMLPFENLSDTLIDPEDRTAPLDLEKLVELNPEVIFAISPTAPTAEVIKGVYTEEFGKTPDIWNALQAVENDNIIYLSNEYVTSKGIHIIESINKLMDMLDEKFPE